MVFHINFSFDVKSVNISMTQNTLLDIAKDYDADNCYFSFEDTLTKKNINIFCIFSLSFTSDMLNNMILCINKIQNVSKIRLDCIFEENITFRLIYASKSYLLSSEKNSVSNYKKFHRERSYSETDSYILNAIRNKRNNSINIDNSAPETYEEYLKRLS